MSKPSIQVFKPFTIDGRTDKSNYHVQEIIYYGESRARHMVAKIIKADAHSAQGLDASSVARRSRMFVYTQNVIYIFTLSQSSPSCVSLA